MRKTRGKTQSSGGYTPVRLQGTNTPVVGEGEYAFRKALKIFNRKVADADIIGEVKSREYYEKPTTRRRRERDQARRRAQRENAERNQPQSW